MDIQNRITQPNGITAAGERSDQDNSPATAHAREEQTRPAHSHRKPRIAWKSSGAGEPNSGQDFPPQSVAGRCSKRSPGILVAERSGAEQHSGWENARYAAHA